MIENVFMLGLLPGPKKPEQCGFALCMRKMADLLLKMEQGFTIQVEDPMRRAISLYVTCRVFLLDIAGDLPALAAMLNIKGHSGVFPCPYCHISGVYLKDKVQGNKKRYPCLTFPRLTNEQEALVSRLLKCRSLAALFLHFLTHHAASTTCNPPAFIYINDMLVLPS
ncbi:hypothetical protein BCR44DRAFT_263554 [Catenaria anguillulae PL171]|uniref:Uncharacterized protein n=1 Tax=Catenaria anguillulae PL171 TaxID=765915 RepID=A0A1Y2H8A6_9FUNG|nr:hypothetical protein BCR44DRAFT_263554 [Catenaria anguillulae PL171]